MISLTPTVDDLAAARSEERAVLDAISEREARGHDAIIRGADRRPMVAERRELDERLGRIRVRQAAAQRRVDEADLIAGDRTLRELLSELGIHIADLVAQLTPLDLRRALATRQRAEDLETRLAGLRRALASASAADSELPDRTATAHLEQLSELAFLLSRVAPLIVAVRERAERAEL